LEFRLSKDVYIFKNNHSKHLLGKRDLSENIYIFKKQFNSRNFSGSADRECIRPHASALKARGEKTRGRFPLVAPLFPLRLFPQRKKTRNAK